MVLPLSTDAVAARHAWRCSSMREAAMRTTNVFLREHGCRLSHAFWCCFSARGRPFWGWEARTRWRSFWAFVFWRWAMGFSQARCQPSWWRAFRRRPVPRTGLRAAARPSARFGGRPCRACPGATAANPSAIGGAIGLSPSGLIGGGRGEDASAKDWGKPAAA